MKEKRLSGPSTATSCSMIKRCKLRTKRSKTLSNPSNSPLTKYSTPTPRKRRSIITPPDPSLTALLRVLMALSSPMDRQPRAKRSQWKGKSVRNYLSTRASFRGWSVMCSTPSQKHIKTSNLESKCRSLNCIWKSWRIFWIRTNRIWRLKKKKKEECSFKI